LVTHAILQVFFQFLDQLDLHQHEGCAIIHLLLRQCIIKVDIMLFGYLCFDRVVTCSARLYIP